MITDGRSKHSAQAWQALVPRSGRLPLAIALSLAAATSQAQEAMDHAGHAAPMDHSQMNQGQMNHDAMHHGASDHDALGHGDMHGSVSQGSATRPPATGIPPGQETRSPVPTLRDTDRAAAVPDLPPHQMHQGGSNFFVLADRLEWQDADDGSEHSHGDAHE